MFALAKRAGGSFLPSGWVVGPVRSGGRAWIRGRRNGKEKKTDKLSGKKRESDSIKRVRALARATLPISRYRYNLIVIGFALPMERVVGGVLEVLSQNVNFHLHSSLILQRSSSLVF